MQNLINGMKLLIFKRVDLNDFNVSLDQFVLLAVVFVCVIFFGSLILSFPNPEFNIYGFAGFSSQLIFITFSAYVLAKFLSSKTDTLTLSILLLSLWPLYSLIWIIIGGSASYNYWQFFGTKKILYFIFNIWMAAVIITTLYRASSANKIRLFSIFIVYILIIAIPSNYISFGNFWHKSYDYEDNKFKLINQENTYYKQFSFIEELRKNLLPQRKGISDIYFVGFGSYASQDVFMKEVQYAQQVLDDKYDTTGRSISLINNSKTVNTIPLASKSNLNLVINHIGKLIDPNDDILFLYLTSHGSKKHKLSVNMFPLELNSISPNDLKEILENSRIKYRVILVSACYSGGFVEPLKDDYTVIFTASAKDKTSFGCSNKNDFTYFGRAIFKDNMEYNFNLISVFDKAIESINFREAKKKLEHSNPQLFIGHKIRKKLEILTREIEKYNNDKFLKLNY